MLRRRPTTCLRAVLQQAQGTKMPARRAGWMAIGLVTFTSAIGGHEWRDVRPRIQSEVHKLQQAEADILLANFCRERLRLVEGVGLTCETVQPGPAFRDVQDIF